MWVYQLLRWEHTGFQTSLILKALLAAFAHSILILILPVVLHLHDPASIWIGRVCGLFKMSFEHQITKNNEIRLLRLKKSELRCEPIFSSRCVACRTITLPSFNSLLKIDWDWSIYNAWCYIGLRGWHHQS